MEKWEEVEKSLENFSEVLKNLPDSLKAKALLLLNKKFYPSEENNGDNRSTGTTSEMEFLVKSEPTKLLNARRMPEFEKNRAKLTSRDTTERNLQSGTTPPKKKGRTHKGLGRASAGKYSIRDEDEEVGEDGMSNFISPSRSSRTCKRNSRFTDFFCSFNDDDDSDGAKRKRVAIDDLSYRAHLSSNSTRKKRRSNSNRDEEGENEGDKEDDKDDDGDDDDDITAEFMKSLEPVTIKIENDNGEEIILEKPKSKKSGKPQIHTGKKYECTTCGKKYSTPYTLKDHQKVHNGEPYVCDHCGHTFTSKTGFRQHQLYHSGESEGVYRCSKCVYVVKSVSLLEDHHRTKHDEDRPKNHVCDVCGKAFYTSHQLERHLLSHVKEKPYKCDLCPFETVFEGYLTKHHNNIHGQGTKEQSYQCEICKVNLRSKGTYRDHLQRHFRFHRKKCDLCHKTFPNASQLAAHKRSHQLPTLPCELCGKYFRNKHKLQEHLLVHSGEKNLQCPHCCYATYARHNMKKHCLNKHSVNWPPDKMPRIKRFDPLQILNENTIKDPVALECVRRVQVSKQNREEAAESGDNDYPDDDIIFDDSNSRYGLNSSRTRLITLVNSNSSQKESCTAFNNETGGVYQFDQLDVAPCQVATLESKISIRPVGLSVTDYLRTLPVNNQQVQHLTTTKTGFEPGIQIRPFVQATMPNKPQSSLALFQSDSTNTL